MTTGFATILFPTDFSACSLAALPQLKALAERHHSQVHVLHVVDESFQNWSALGPESMPIVVPMDDLVKDSEIEMAGFVKKNLEDLENPVKTKVIIGRPFYEIIRMAREIRAGLIVMSTHGRGGLAHVLIGSTAEKVVRKAPCPVLTVRDPAHDFKMP